MKEEYTQEDYRLACEMAKTRDFDVIRFEKIYKGFPLFRANKSCMLHRYAGYPIFVHIINGKASELSFDESLLIRFPDN